MNKLKELIRQGWVFSACYNEDEFYLVATYGALDIVRSAMHANLEMATIELCEKCEAVNDLPITSPS
jgi:hypothetical protein